MKSPFAKFPNSNDALESALRGSAPKLEFPPELHDSIMYAVHATDRTERTKVSAMGLLQRLIKVGWFPISGFAGLVLFAVLLLIHNRPVATTHDPQPLAEISKAFTTGQEFVDALPSVTVGPLSDELEKVNRDLDRTAEFLIATLP
jgi:hypothetical protein